MRAFFLDASGFNNTVVSSQGDITSADLVNYVLRKEGIDTIMHFAAQTHVDNSFGNSIAFTQSNILGTHGQLCESHYCTDPNSQVTHVYSHLRHFCSPP